MKRKKVKVGTKYGGTKRIRATIDIDVSDDIINDELATLNRGSFGCDNGGAFMMYFKSRTNLVEFKDVVELGDNENGFDTIKLEGMSWIDDDETGVGFVMIDDKKFTVVLKEDKKFKADKIRSDLLAEQKRRKESGL